MRILILSLLGLATAYAQLDFEPGFGLPTLPPERAATTPKYVGPGSSVAAGGLPESTTPKYTGPGSSPAAGGLPEGDTATTTRPFVYTGPGSSPAAGGLPEGDTATTTRPFVYTGPGSSPAAGGLPDGNTTTTTRPFVYTGPGSSPAAGGIAHGDRNATERSPLISYFGQTSPSFGAPLGQAGGPLVFMGASWGGTDNDYKYTGPGSSEGTGGLPDGLPGDDGNSFEEDAIATYIEQGFDPEIAEILHHEGPVAAAEALQERLDDLDSNGSWFPDPAVLFEQWDQQTLLGHILTDEFGLDAEQAEGAMSLVLDGADPEVAALYMQIQTGDVEVNIHAPIPDWQIIALFNNDDTLLEVSGAGQENFNGDFYISEKDARHVIDNAENFSPNAVAMATYMLANPDDTLDIHYGPEPGNEVDGWGDIIPSVWNAFDPTNGDSLWGELADMGGEIGHEFTKVPGNLVDASVELVMQPVHLWQAGHDCVTNPNLPACGEVAITVVTIAVARKVGPRSTSVSASNGWVLPAGGGGAHINGRWYTEHVLERMAPNTPQVRAELEARALARADNLGLRPGTAEFGEWWAKNHPNPRGVPPSVVEAEILNPGSTGIRVILNDAGDVVTVIPE